MEGWGMEDYRNRLIDLARELAGPSVGDEEGFLRRFRTYYQHLAVTVETSGGGTSINPMTMNMGMDPFMRTPEQVTELLDRTDANLRELGR
jgi:hypothetical protein